MEDLKPSAKREKTKKWFLEGENKNIGERKKRKERRRKDGDNNLTFSL